MQIFVLFFLVFLNSSLQADNQSWKNQDAYVQLSSVVTQIPNLGLSSIISGETIDMVKNFQITPNRDAVVCQIPGLYYISCGLQPATIERRCDTIFEFKTIC
jgi:hypothetical protein